MAGILKVDRIQEANSGQGVELSHKLVDTSGNTIISENNGVATFGSSVAPSTNYTFRNRIINGNFDIWQRGTSFTASEYTSDRFRITAVGSSTHENSRQSFANGQTEVPNNPTYFSRTIVTTANNNGDLVVLLQKVESVRSLAGKTATLSFWAKADSNKSIATEFSQYFGSGGSPSGFVNEIGITTHTLTTSWQKFTTTVSIPSISGKTIGTDNNDTLTLYFYFDAGSNFNSRTNSLGNQSGRFDIAQVQLEEGTVPTPFEHRPIETELALCQRYFQISPAYAYLPAANGNATSVETNFFLPTPMRATPTFSTSTGSYDTSIYHPDVRTIGTGTPFNINYATNSNIVRFIQGGFSGMTTLDQPCTFQSRKDILISAEL